MKTESRSVLAEVKAVYFQLAYLAKTLTILESDGEFLKQVEQAADARYRSGKGTQQDVLQAQLQKTKLIREIAMHHLAVGKLEAQLKQLLDRSQSSPDIEPADLACVLFAIRSVAKDQIAEFGVEGNRLGKVTVTVERAALDR